VGTAPGSCLLPESFGAAPAYEPCSKLPVRVNGISGATSIAAGEQHVLVLLADGTVRAWGINTYGQVGNGTTAAVTTPVAVAGLTQVARIAAGADFSLAVRSDGAVWAWGNGTHGELGIGSGVPSTCAGEDVYDRSVTSVRCARTPVQVTGVTSVAEISALGRHALALRTDGSVWAWGSNHYGQIGDSSTANRLSPFAVPSLGNVAKIAAGFSHSMALGSNGAVWAWGLDADGQLGVAASQTCPNQYGAIAAACSRSPVQAVSHAGASSIVAGGAHTIAVRADYSLDAFGFNGSGQLGYGSATLSTMLANLDPHIGFNLIGGIGPSTALGIPSAAGGLNLGTIDIGVSFGSQAVGTSSASREVRFKNVRDTRIGISSVTVNGNFGLTTTCGAILEGDTSCSAFVTFAPTLPGRRDGTLAFATDSPDAPLASLPLSGTGTSTTIPLNYSDIWWNPNESGWGLTIADHETNLFAVWYTYDVSGRPTWFTVPGGTFTQSRRFFSGDVYATTGPCYSAPAFDTNLVRATRVGSATIDFAPADLPSGWARFSGSIGATGWSRTITRQPFGNASTSWGSDYTDIWWYAPESGWGLSLSQHGNNVFGVLFTYDCDGTPLFVALPSVAFSAPNAFSGDVYTTRSSGSWWGSPAFNPAGVTASRVGTASVAFSGRTATFAITINGSTRTRTVVQQPFGHRAPGTP
jgi:hypothetical protein